HHGEIELGYDHDELAAVSAGVVFLVDPVAELDVVQVPVVAIRPARVHGVPDGADRDPALAHDAFAVPDAAVEVELAELQGVSRADVQTAAHVALAGRSEIHVVRA